MKKGLLYNSKDKKQRVNLRNFEAEYKATIKKFKEDIKNNNMVAKNYKKSLIYTISISLVLFMLTLSNALLTSALTPVLTIILSVLGALGTGISIGLSVHNIIKLKNLNKSNASLKEILKANEQILNETQTEIKVLDNKKEQTKKIVKNLLNKETNKTLEKTQTDKNNENELSL